MIYNVMAPFIFNYESSRYSNDSDSKFPFPLNKAESPGASLSSDSWPAVEYELRKDMRVSLVHRSAGILPYSNSDSPNPL